MSLIYRNCFNGYPCEFIPHWSLPRHNLVSLDDVTCEENIADVELDRQRNFDFINNEPILQDFNFNVSKTQVLHCGKGRQDFVRKLLHDKFTWGTMFKQLYQTRITNDSIKQLQNLRSGVSKTVSPSLVKFLELMEMEPEPYFNGTYNWLYTGGNLTSLNINDTFCLFGAEDRRLKIFSVRDDNILYSTQFKMKIDQQILQLRADSTTVCVRQKNNIIVGKVDEALMFDIVFKKKVSYPKFCTSADILNNYCAYSDSERKLVVCDIVHNKCFYNSYVKKYEKCDEHWNQLMFKEPNLIYFADRGHVYIIDIRENTRKPSVKHKPSLDSCDRPSIFFKNTKSDRLYAAMTHTLAEIDWRSVKNCKKWTHLMKNPPCYGKFVDPQLVVLGNQCNELVAISSHQVLPSFVSNFKDTLRHFQCNGKVLSPSVNHYSSFCHTGLTVVRESNDISLFTQNSCGDIFVSKISKKDEISVDNFNLRQRRVASKLKDYEVKCNKRWKHSTMYATSVKDGSYLYNVLKTPVEPEKKKARRHPHWKYCEMMSSKSLKYYKDFLAVKTLSVWSLSSDEVDTEPAKQDTADDIIDAKDKVELWLRHSNYK